MSDSATSDRQPRTAPGVKIRLRAAQQPYQRQSDDAAILDHKCWWFEPGHRHDCRCIERTARDHMPRCQLSLPQNVTQHQRGTYGRETFMFNDVGGFEKHIATPCHRCIPFAATHRHGTRRHGEQSKHQQLEAVLLGKGNARLLQKRSVQ